MYWIKYTDAPSLLTIRMMKGRHSDGNKNFPMLTTIAPTGTNTLTINEITVALKAATAVGNIF